MKYMDSVKGATNTLVVNLKTRLGTDVMEREKSMWLLEVENNLIA